MIPDPLRRRIKIPVRIGGSSIQPLDGSKLPEFKSDAEAELVFEASALKNPTDARELTAERVVTVLPARTRLFFGVSREMIADARPKGLIEPDPLGAASWLLACRICNHRKLADA